VAGSRVRLATAEQVRVELERQTRFQPEPDGTGLEELAELLARRFAGEPRGPAGELERLEAAFPRQPLIHLYGFALRREAGAAVAARTSLDALLAIDPEDPIARYLQADLDSAGTVPASEETRLANIAKLAGTPLLKNPYSMAVGVLFDAIRNQERARVLDIGIGSGAQMELMLGLLARAPNRLRLLEIVGLDFMPQFLAAAGERIAVAAEPLAGRVQVVYEPIEGRVETLEAPAVRVATGRGVDGANASISLHEVAGEAKLAALANLRRIRPGRLALAEWNYCLENLLPPTSTEFLFNVRRVAAAMVAALRERYPIQEARAVVRDWLSQGTGQLTCPADQRQECFLDIASWKALLEQSGFTVLAADGRWLEHAAAPRHADIAPEGWYLKTSDPAGETPIAVVVATPTG
jgi:GRAS domain family